ncbi:MAG TPA: NAD(P)/FAD-dependent oxidoreductase [Candidatus Paceibacterota bacterium]|jgi:monoamine oxidase|nr:NAD(P)/FAD-dependent oxidoreductase [Candidatus Paceibacterota bacterium]
MKSDIIVIGAGASGLMAARELGKNGKKILVLEARDRVGGRIAPISEEMLGYPLEGAAEFVHGNGAVTRALLAEANMHVVPVEGDYWSVHSGSPKKNDFLEVEKGAFTEKLSTLTEDISMSEFISAYFSDEKYEVLRNDVTRMIEGYDAGDLDRISALAIRDEWANEEGWEQGRVMEGYGAMVAFLESECKKQGTEIVLNTEVTGIEMTDQGVAIHTKTGAAYEAEKVIVTVALPIIKTISFTPAIPEKMAAIDAMGFGPAIKMFLKFKTEFWKPLNNGEYKDMQMIISNELMSTWWTQYPHDIPIITGWFAGPKVWQFKESSDEEILDIALTCLAKTFSLEKEMLQNELVASKVMNWAADPYTQGAYSYPTVGYKESADILLESIQDKLFFAGEALYTGKEIATVEGALASGKEVAEKILSIPA